MLRPAMVCSTFGVSDRILVPGPAAKPRIAVSPRNDINTPLALSLALSHGSREVEPPTRCQECHFTCTGGKTHICPTCCDVKRSAKKLRRQDSNLNFLNQNQRCCRLHHDGLPTRAGGRLIADRANKTLDGLWARGGPRESWNIFTYANGYADLRGSPG